MFIYIYMYMYVYIHTYIHTYIHIYPCDLIGNIVYIYINFIADQVTRTKNIMA